jgi:hypothetical protein
MKLDKPAGAALAVALETSAQLGQPFGAILGHISPRLVEI